MNAHLLDFVDIMREINVLWANSKTENKYITDLDRDMSLIPELMEMHKS